ncbi:uncharacterized protein TM35_000401450 [Trypanosoma theileri]|uniref:Uncharacterized protein n=1 Tax=Trypanosoma theileri TaxID=67003 RepID=A0A1X0NK39_9TRYP|nr:uncharacterized protein TM35_000401450 [Trypanosoma theileri]ORC84878.1 hypothetical protein TM35_000401450 [Trypanosoma theileri]
MTGGVHVRAAAAVRTAVLWVSLCMLLQHLGHHPQFTAEAMIGSVQVNIVRYFSFPHSIFRLTKYVNYGASADACNTNGGFLVTGQSLAAQNTITEHLKNNRNQAYPEVLAYMGGDAIYSIRFDPDPNIRCTPGIEGASLNCIYRWNQGLFTRETSDGRGVDFYRGSLYSLPGAGPLNGYTMYWRPKYPARGNPYVVSQYTFIEGTQATWYDAPVNAYLDPDLNLNGFVVVCEVQSSSDGSTLVPTDTPTTAPPAEASEPSWIKKHWYVPLIIALVVLAAIIGLIILCCCLGGRNEEKYLYPMATREDSDMPIRAREITDYDGNVNEMNLDDRGMVMVPSHPMPMEGIDSANVSVYSVAENDIYGDGDVFSEGNR